MWAWTGLTLCICMPSASFATDCLYIIFVFLLWVLRFHWKYRCYWRCFGWQDDQLENASCCFGWQDDQLENASCCFGWQDDQLENASCCFGWWVGEIKTWFVLFWFDKLVSQRCNPWWFGLCNAGQPDLICFVSVGEMTG